MILYLHVCCFLFFLFRIEHDLIFVGIISLGDANAYLLSTAEENLGVITARSVAGKLILKMLTKKNENLIFR
jgi:exosome complex RNA-binding protein Csl4